MSSPLAGVTVLEASSADCPQVLRLAIGMAGRVAADLGARVNQLHPTGSAFLDAGKQAGRAAADAVILDDAYAFEDLPPVRSVLSLFAPGHAPVGVCPTEFTLMALGGLLDIVGEPEREPLRLGGHQLAYAAGLAAYGGLIGGLLRAPSVARISLLDVAVWLNWKSAAAAFYLGEARSRSGRLADWPVLRCADGWVAMVQQPQDWDALCRVLALEAPHLATPEARRTRRAELADLLEDALAHLTRAELQARSKQLRLPLGPVWTLEELRQDPQLTARDFLKADGIPRVPVLWNGQRPSWPGLTRPATPRPLAGPDHDPDPPCTAGGTASPLGPLAGCRVLDLGIITAGAATGAFLADLGADVIKLESPGYRDPFRAWAGPPAKDPGALPPFFRCTNRNKRGISLDLKQPDGRGAFLRLVAKADVVVENFRRGVLERLGIGFKDLRRANPRIILASISSQGETGPLAQYVSFGTTLEAVGGLAAMTGYADGPPVVSGRELNLPDQLVALFAGSTIMTAWLARKAGTVAAEAIHLDLSQRELTSFMIGEAFAAGATPARAGNTDPTFALQDCASCRDGWIAVSVTASQLPALLTLIGAADTAGLRAWCITRDEQAVLRLLAEAGIAAAPVRNGHDLLESGTGAWSHALAWHDGALLKGFPLQFDGAPLAIARDAPQVGADTASVLAELGGYAAEEIDDLHRRGAAEAPR